MKKHSAKLNFLFFIILVSSNLVAQNNKVNDIRISPSHLVGTWIGSNIDSSFNHKSSLEFTFTKDSTFSMKYLLDGMIKEKYNGKFRVNNGRILAFEMVNRKQQHLEIVNLTNNRLEIKEVGTKDVIILRKN